MAEIVRELLRTYDKESIMFQLQMEDEEVDRLAERAGSPEVVSRNVTEFKKGWVPE